MSVCANDSARQCNPNETKMIRSSLFLPKFGKNLSFCQANFSSKATKKVLGYNEKPDVSEIKADYIGKLEMLNSYIKR
jgi:hypothetical protein